MSDNRLISISNIVEKYSVMRLAETADEFARLVAGRVLARRLALGMSKLAVARAAGLDQRAITFVENSTRVPSISTLYRIAFALGTTVGDLVKEASKEKA